MEKEYYGPKDIMRLTGRCRTTAGEILHKLNENLIVEYPNIKIIDNNLIPIWYWNQKTKPIEEKKEEIQDEE